MLTMVVLYDHRFGGIWFLEPEGISKQNRFIDVNGIGNHKGAGGVGVLYKKVRYDAKKKRSGKAGLVKGDAAAEETRQRSGAGRGWRCGEGLQQPVFNRGIGREQGGVAVFFLLCK